MTKIGVAILGATGAVGQRFIALLKNHPWFEVQEVVASGRSAGISYAEVTNWVLDDYPPQAVADMTVKSTDATLESPIVFSALPSEVAVEVEMRLAIAGHVVCSNASAHRMLPDVPLLIPEVNADHMRLIDMQREKRGWEHGAVVTNSNCTSMPVTMALAPLLQFKPLKLHMVSMQAISGAGYPGVASLDILDNIVPFIRGEEEKLQTEPAKMLGRLVDDGRAIDPLEMVATAACNRVPVVDAHLVSVAVNFGARATVANIMDAWMNFRGPEEVRGLPSAPERPVIVAQAEDRPQPRRDRYAGGGMSTVVGRLRDCPSIDGFQFLALAHNTIRGAAGCSILNAELLVKEGYVSDVSVELL
jgi:aspartate-semialdehyde dehydrogenase